MSRSKEKKQEKMSAGYNPAAKKTVKVVQKKVAADLFMIGKHKKEENEYGIGKRFIDHTDQLLIGE